MPIYLDSPMAERATEVFARHVEELHIDAADCQAACALAVPVQSPQQSMHLGNDRAPKIILAASGMAARAVAFCITSRASAVASATPS